MRFVIFCLFLTMPVMAEDFGYLNAKDQTFFKNDSQAGMNKMERIDANVKEINNLHRELALLKKEVAALRDEVAQMRNKGR